MLYWTTDVFCNFDVFSIHAKQKHFEGEQTNLVTWLTSPLRLLILPIIHVYQCRSQTAKWFIKIQDILNIFFLSAVAAAFDILFFGPTFKSIKVYSNCRSEYQFPNPASQAEGANGIQMVWADESQRTIFGRRHFLAIRLLYISIGLRTNDYQASLKQLTKILVITDGARSYHVFTYGPPLIIGNLHQNIINQQCRVWMNDHYILFWSPNVLRPKVSQIWWMVY